MATAASIIVLPIEQGVAVGIALSLLHGIWSTTRARLIQFERVPDTTIWWPASPHLPGERNPDIAVVGLQAPLSFLNAQNFRADVLDVVKRAKPRLLVLEASGIIEIDFTAAQILLDLIRECRDDGVTVAMARLESTRAQDAFERFGHLRRAAEGAHLPQRRRSRAQAGQDRRRVTTVTRPATDARAARRR